MNKNVIVFSIIVITFISLLFLFSLFGILLFYWSDANAFKDSLSIVSGIFGGITTLGAAVIAAYLFNDWKVQHNKQVQNNLSLQVFDAFLIFEKNIREYALYISHLQGLKNSYDGFELTWEILNRDGNLVYLQNINSKKDEMDLNFFALIDKLRRYYIFNNENYEINGSCSIILSKYFDIGKNNLTVITLTDQLIDYETKYLGYIDLKNMIDSAVINKIITSLNA